jgi:heme exporter protein D
MADAKSTSNEDTAVGCLGLIALGIVLSIIGFVIEHWEFFVGAAVVIGCLAVVGLVARTVYQSTVGQKQAQDAAAAQARSTREAALNEARKAGRHSMRAAWLEGQIRPGAAPRDSTGAASVTELLAVVPTADWDLAQLRKHGRAVWARRGGAPGQHLRADVEARLDRVAAMISDLTDEEFDTHRGQADDQYLYHPDREVRAAYLEGGAQAVETIMDTVTAARAQAREDTAAKAAADSLAQQRNAALKALRETRQSTETRDAHAAWERQARQLDD